jgi:Holliday junction resolvase RusA-like endonuclease
MMTLEDKVSFVVAGLPVPQGSSRAFVVRGKAIVTSSNRNLKAWRDRIANEAQRAQDRSHFYREDGCAYSVDLLFSLPRPKDLPKCSITLHTKKPDLDKLIRAVLDGITGILIRDDSEVCSIVANKRYVNRLGEDPPGVKVEITRWNRTVPL